MPNKILASLKKVLLDKDAIIKAHHFVEIEHISTIMDSHYKIKVADTYIYQTKYSIHLFHENSWNASYNYESVDFYAIGTTIFERIIYGK